jgi:hypothetical protein
VPHPCTSLCCPSRRQNEDGTLTRESNARYVKWSDGSESIVLGDELLMLDRKQQPRANTYVHVVRYDAIQVGCVCRVGCCAEGLAWVSGKGGVTQAAAARQHLRACRALRRDSGVCCVCYGCVELTG